MEYAKSEGTSQDSISPNICLVDPKILNLPIYSSNGNHSVQSTNGTQPILSTSSNRVSISESLPVTKNCDSQCLLNHQITDLYKNMHMSGIGYTINALNFTGLQNYARSQILPGTQNNHLPKTGIMGTSEHDERTNSSYTGAKQSDSVDSKCMYRTQSGVYNINSSIASRSNLTGTYDCPTDINTNIGNISTSEGVHNTFNTGVVVNKTGVNVINTATNSGVHGCDKPLKTDSLKKSEEIERLINDVTGSVAVETNSGNCDAVKDNFSRAFKDIVKSVTKSPLDRNRETSTSKHWADYKAKKTVTKLSQDQSQHSWDMSKHYINPAKHLPIDIIKQFIDKTKRDMDKSKHNTNKNKHSFTKQTPLKHSTDKSKQYQAGQLINVHGMEYHNLLAGNAQNNFGIERYHSQQPNNIPENRHEVQSCSKSEKNVNLPNEPYILGDYGLQNVSQSDKNNLHPAFRSSGNTEGTKHISPTGAKNMPSDHVNLPLTVTEFTSSVPNNVNCHKEEKLKSKSSTKKSDVTNTTPGVETNTTPGGDSGCQKLQFSCNECGKQFRFNSHWHRHIRTHFSVKPFKCSICDKAFSQNHSLAHHMRTHTGEAPYKCETCGKCFRENSNLVRHIRTHTGERPYKCAHCDRGFISSSTLTLHMKTVHMNDKSFSCDECGKGFATSSKLASHVISHSSEKKYRCFECGKWFARQGSLRAHVKRHSGKKPYECKDCGKKFSAGGNFRRHLKLHSGEKPYKCKYCDKHFAVKYTLTTHLRKHTGDSPYKCKYCDKAFAHKQQMLVHVEKKTCEVKVECDVCNKVFKRKGSLTLHRKMHGRKDETSGNLKVLIPSKKKKKNQTVKEKQNKNNKTKEVDNLSVSLTNEIIKFSDNDNSTNESDRDISDIDVSSNESEEEYNSKSDTSTNESAENTSDEDLSNEKYDQKHHKILANNDKNNKNAVNSNDYNQTQDCKSTKFGLKLDNDYENVSDDEVDQAMKDKIKSITDKLDEGI